MLLDRQGPQGPTAAPRDTFQVRRVIAGQTVLLEASRSFVLQPNDVVVITSR